MQQYEEMSCVRGMMDKPKVRYFYPLPLDWTDENWDFIRNNYQDINNNWLPEVIRIKKLKDKKECSYCDRPFGDSLDRIVWQMPRPGKKIPFDYSEDAGPFCVICDFCYHRRFREGYDNIPEEVRESYLKRNGWKSCGMRDKCDYYL